MYKAYGSFQSDRKRRKLKRDCRASANAYARNDRRGGIMDEMETLNDFKTHPRVLPARNDGVGETVKYRKFAFNSVGVAQI